MFKKSMTFLKLQNILYKHQYGFRPKHSTIHPIIHLLNNCAQANNNNPKKLQYLFFFIESVWRDILKRKLGHYGIRGKAKTWIANYLANRSQYVQFENCRSESQKLEYGVPQGSILGPLLYLLYVNDIANCTKANIISFFADDTSLFVTNSNITELYEHANTEIQKLFVKIISIKSICAGSTWYETIKLDLYEKIWLRILQKVAIIQHTNIVESISTRYIYELQVYPNFKQSGV